MTIFKERFIDLFSVFFVIILFLNKTQLIIGQLVMKLKYFFAVLSFLCSYAMIHAQTIEFEFNLGQYSLEMPSTWKQSPLKGQNLIHSYLMYADKLYPNLNIMIEPYPKMADPNRPIEENVLKHLEHSLIDFKLLQKEYLTIHGIKMFKTVSIWYSILGDLKATRLMISSDKEVLIITLVDRIEFYEEHVDTFNWIEESIRLKKQEDIPDKEQ